MLIVIPATTVYTSILYFCKLVGTGEFKKLTPFVFEMEESI